MEAFILIIVIKNKYLFRLRFAWLSEAFAVKLCLTTKTGVTLIFKLNYLQDMIKKMVF